MLSLVLVCPACSAALEVDSCEHEGECEETGLVQLRRMNSDLSTRESGGICCFTGCDLAPQGCNPTFESDPQHGHCSEASDVCTGCNGHYCPAPPQPTPSPTPNGTSGVCCFNPGCQGCNDEHNYCSQSKERCDKCVARSANKNGGYCDAPSSLLQVQKQQDTPDDYLSPCADKPNEPCDVYKEKGYCDTTAVGVDDPNVQHYCRKTCGLCNCYDLDPSCPASGHFCQAPNKAEQLHMHTTCPWTCGQCPGR